MCPLCTGSARIRPRPSVARLKKRELKSVLKSERRLAYRFFRALIFLPSKNRGGEEMPIIREYQSSSDRSARDRAAHNKKHRDLIKKNLPDLIAEESIITKKGDEKIKVPIKGIKEYRYVYSPGGPGVGQADKGKVKKGDVLKKGKGKAAGPGKKGKAGSEPGEDIYELETTVEEIIEMLFEELELPDMEKKKFRFIESEKRKKIKGRRKVGIKARLDKKRSAQERIKRKKAAERAKEEQEEEEEFPYHKEDLRYRHMVKTIKKESNAVVICIMDTSGSMDTMKKFLARSFYFLLYNFVRIKYKFVDLVFIAHHTEAKEVTEDEFFHKGESGGTRISFGYAKALEIIKKRYHPSLWNIYAFHCSDGENWDDDNRQALKLANQLCAVSNLFGYGEIKPGGQNWGSMIEILDKIEANNFAIVQIRNKEEVYPMFKKLLNKERVKE